MTGATQIIYFNQTTAFTNNNWALYIGYPVTYNTPTQSASLSGVTVDPAGQIYACGYLNASSFAGYVSTFAVYSISAFGVIAWSYNWGTGAGTNTYANAITLDGTKFYTTGVGSRGGYATTVTFKYDTSGVADWVTKVSQPQPSSSDQGPTSAYAICSNPTLGKIYAAGTSYLFGITKGQIYTYNTSGSLVDQAYFGAGGNDFNTKSLVIDSSNNVWATGNIYFANVINVAKFDSDLNLLAFKTLAFSTASPVMYSWSINKDSSGYIYVSGTGADSSSAPASMIIAKYDSAMNLIASQKYSYTDSYAYYASSGRSAVDPSNNNIFLVGKTVTFPETVHILKVNPTTLSIIYSNKLEFVARDYTSNLLNLIVSITHITVQGTDYYLTLSMTVQGGLTSLPTQTFGLLLKLPTDGTLTSPIARQLEMSEPTYFYPADLDITYNSVSGVSNSSVSTTITSPVASAVNYGFPTYTSVDVPYGGIPFNVNKPFV